MAAALFTAAVLSLVGTIASAVIGLTIAGEGDLVRHTTLGVFTTMVTLLTHSMMMFYLIGKTKAIREAVTEHALAGDFVAETITLRRPVFRIATLAMAAVMITAFVGASVDTRVVPPIAHAMVSYAAVAANLAAVRVELRALIGNARIVAEVNQRIGVSE
jgi:hypothetical protein